jgi:hypothetical protein
MELRKLRLKFVWEFVLLVGQFEIIKMIVVFNRVTKPSFLQIISRVASLIHMWSFLYPVD